MTLHFVYTGAASDGVNGLAAREKFRGMPFDGALDFVNYLSDWGSAVGAAGGSAWAWGQERKRRAALTPAQDFRLMLSIPLAVSSGANADLASVGQGKANASFLTMAQSLVSNGHADAYVRPGWEPNGGYYPWAAAGKVSDYQAAHRQCVETFRSVPGQKFRFVWCPAMYMGQVYPDQIYPGNDVVDVIAMDVYPQSWESDAFTAPNVANEPKFSNYCWGDAWGLNSLPWFAGKQGKPMGMGEVAAAGTRSDGHGGGDSLPFFQMLEKQVDACEVVSWWFYHAGDFDGDIAEEATLCPKVAAAWQAKYGKAQAVTTPTPAPTPSPAPAKAAALTVTGEPQTVKTAPTVTLTPNADGSVGGYVSMGAAPAGTHWVFDNSVPRKMGWGDGKGGLSGGLWNNGQPMAQWTWDQTDGKPFAADLYFAPS